MNSWGAVLGRALHVALVPGRELGIHNFILVIERRLKLFVPHMYGSLILDHRRL
jgi:hypothetical protein